MARFKGFVCDSCGEKLEEDQLNTRTVTFKGPAVPNGRYTQELCGDCVEVPEGVELKALPGRKPGGAKKAAPRAAARPAAVVS